MTEQEIISRQFRAIHQNDGNVFIYNNENDIPIGYTGLVILNDYDKCGLANCYPQTYGKPNLIIHLVSYPFTAVIEDEFWETGDLVYEF